MLLNRSSIGKFILYTVALCIFFNGILVVAEFVQSFRAEGIIAQAQADYQSADERIDIRDDQRYDLLEVLSDLNNADELDKQEQRKAACKAAHARVSLCNSGKDTCYDAETSIMDLEAEWFGYVDDICEDVVDTWDDLATFIAM